MATDVLLVNAKVLVAKCLVLNGCGVQAQEQRRTLYKWNIANAGNVLLSDKRNLYINYGLINYYGMKNLV